MRTVVLSLLILWPVLIFGQSEALTNEKVVEMVNVGLSADVVKRSIAVSNAKFDVSPTALIELKRARVPDDVITAMIDRFEALSITAPAAGYSDSGSPLTTGPEQPANLDKKQIITSARTIALGKSSAHPSRQALEKELMKRADFKAANLTIIRYKDTADLYVEIGRVPLSWLTHRYVYRIFDRRSGTVLAAGETTSWGSLAENLARHISKSLTNVRLQS